MAAVLVKRTMVAAAIATSLWLVGHCDPAAALESGCVAATAIVSDRTEKEEEDQ